VVRGQVLLRLGRARDAAEAFDRALALDPDNANARAGAAAARERLTSA